MPKYIFLTLSFLISCSAKNIDDTPPFQINFEARQAIVFEGKINSQNIAKFEKAFHASNDKITTLIINSPGGEVFAGMQLGKLVNKYKLDVVVKGICGSTCANYVITASPNVIVNKGALIGWHGGSFQPYYSSLEPSFIDKVLLYFSKTPNHVDEYINKWQNEEMKFFNQVKVNSAITVLGMMPGLKRKRDAMLFSYDPYTLKRLGVNIEFKGKQAEHSKSNKKIVQIFHLNKDLLTKLLEIHRKNVEELSN